MTNIRPLSVTANDPTNPIIRYMVVDSLMASAALHRDLPVYWSLDRDLVLRSTPLKEGMWGSAVGISITKVQAASYKIQGKIAGRVQRMHRLLQFADFGAGYRSFMGKIARDFLLTDNGAFVEIVRASPAPGSRIVGLAHLDSLRCWRTGDPDQPVVYTDKVGKPHVMRDDQVLTFCDMPSFSSDGRGVGLCAASRAYTATFKMWAADTFVSEGMSGRTPTKLTFVNGMNQRNVDDAMDEARARADAAQLRIYMGVALSANPSDKPLSEVSIPLREIPQGFNIEQERKDAYLKMANALGIDPQELQPLSGSALGTATQSQVLDDKASGKGLSAFFGSFVEQLNLRVMAQGCTFSFQERDLRDELSQADGIQRRASARATMIANGEINAQQSQQIAVEAGDIPRSVIPDQTPGDTVTSEDPADDSLEAQVQDAFTEAAVLAVTPGADLLNKVQAAFVQAATGKERQKAAGVQLVRLDPKATARRRNGSAYLKNLTGLLDEYGRLLTLALKKEAPQSGVDGESGKLRDSIRYRVVGRDTRDVELQVWAGNKDRPEVVIRSNLFGRRGFGPKDPKGVLAFPGKDGEMVFTKHVGPADPNPWLERAWNETEAQRRSLYARAGAFDREMIDESDVQGADKPHIDGSTNSLYDAEGNFIGQGDPVTA